MREDGAHLAQKLGGIGGVVLADGLAFHHNSLEVAVVDQGNKFHRYILGKGVCVVVDAGAPQPQFIEDSGYQPGLLVGELGIDAKVLPHQLQKGLGGENIVACLQIFLEGLGHPGVGIGGGEDLVRPLAPLQVFLKPGAAVGAGGSGGVDKGLGFGNGQGVGPLHPLLLTQLQQPQDGPADSNVPVLAFHSFNQIQIQGNGVDLLVGHQHLAVAVGENTPGGLHRLGGGYLAGGFGQVRVFVDYLGVIQDNDEADKAQGEKAQQQG